MWSEMKRSFKDRLDVENSSWLSKYHAEFLLERNSMCEFVSFPDYLGWDRRETSIPTNLDCVRA